MKNTLSIVLKSPFYFLSAFIVGGIFFATLNLFFQYEDYETDVKTSISNLQQTLVSHFKTIQTTLSSTGNLLTHQNIDTTAQTLEIISQEANLPGLFAIGHFARLNTQQTTQWFEQLRQQGDNNLFFKNSALSKHSNSQNLNTHLIITKLFPFAPAQLQLLGKDVMTLPQMPSLINKMPSEEQTNLLPLILNHKPYLFIFWQSALFKNYGGLFYLFDLKADLTKALRQSSSLRQANALIQFNLSTQATIQNHTQKASFLNTWLSRSKTITLQPNDHLIRIKLSIPFSTDHLNWKQTLAVLLFGSLIGALIGYLLLQTQNYLVRLSQQNTRQNELLKQAYEAIIMTDAHGKILHWNPMSEHLFGYLKEEVKGKYIQDILFKQAQGQNTALLNEFKLQPLPPKTHIQLLSKKSTYLDCEMSVSQIHVAHSDEWVFFIEDISHEIQTKLKIKQLAYFDKLTQLENRTYFTEQLKDYFAATETQHPPGALLFLDLDGFKKVNDSLGHSTGDELLSIVSKRFLNSIRTANPHTHLCRFGGDEFVFYLNDMSEKATTKTALRLLEQAKKPIKIKHHVIEVSASIGIAYFPQQGRDLDTLLQHADTAMYEAKRMGKNTFSVYQQAMETKLATQILIERHLRLAIKNDELELFYQPQISTKTRAIIGVEALIRWQSQELGFVPPDEFISIAEESGLINDIGDWVAQKAISQLKKWQNGPLAHLRVAINVSANQLNSGHFSEKINDWLTAQNVEPNKLEIELTERAVMENAQENINIFNNIRAHGLSLSVDDFGTGYSSLSYLKRFPLNILKVDKSFVDGLPGDEEDVAISSAIIQLAHNLHMNVVAEGVETKEQLEFLTAIGCDLIQGYYYSRPLPPKEFLKWAKEYEANRTNQTSSLTSNTTQDSES